MSSKKEEAVDVAVRPLLLYPAVFITGMGLDAAAGVAGAIPTFPRTGGGVFLAGSALVGWAFRTLKKSGATGKFEGPVAVLSVEGPYRWSRNPVYVGMSLMYLGASIGSAGALAMFPVLLAAMSWGVVFREERFLSKKFGETYELYRRRVPRWI